MHICLCIFVLKILFSSISSPELLCGVKTLDELNSDRAGGLKASLQFDEQVDLNK